MCWPHGRARATATRTTQARHYHRKRSAASATALPSPTLFHSLLPFTRCSVHTLLGFSRQLATPSGAATSLWSWMAARRERRHVVCSWAGLTRCELRQGEVKHARDGESAFHPRRRLAAGGAKQQRRLRGELAFSSFAGRLYLPQRI